MRLASRSVAVAAAILSCIAWNLRRPREAWICPGNDVELVRSQQNWCNLSRCLTVLDLSRNESLTGALSAEPSGARGGWRDLDCFQATGLDIAPLDPAFQTWLQGIPER